MIVDIDKFTFYSGLKITKPGGTSSWSTSFGQGKEYKTKEKYLFFREMFNESQIPTDFYYNTKTKEKKTEWIGLLKFTNITINKNDKIKIPFAIAAGRSITGIHKGRESFYYGKKTSSEIMGINNELFFAKLNDFYGENWVIWEFDIKNYNTIDFTLTTHIKDRILFDVEDRRKKVYSDLYNITPYSGNREKYLPKYYKYAEIILKKFLINGLSLREIELNVLDSNHEGDVAKSILNTWNIDTASASGNKGCLENLPTSVQKSIVSSIFKLKPKNVKLPKPNKRIWKSDGKFPFKKTEDTKVQRISNANLHKGHDEILNLIDLYSKELGIDVAFEKDYVDASFQTKNQHIIMEVKSNESEIDKAIGQLLRYELDFLKKYNEKPIQLVLVLPAYTKTKKYDLVLRNNKINTIAKKDIKSFLKNSKI